MLFPAGQPVPQRKPTTVTQDKPHCLSKGPLLDEGVIVHPKTRGIKNVVVWLRPDDATDPPAKFAPHELPPDDAKRKPQEVVIETPCCQFVPHVVAARAGDTLVVKNPSPVAHGFFLVGPVPAGAVMNITVPPRGEFRVFGALPAGAGTHEFKCTIHPWMNGYLRVFEHPFYAVTDEGGGFTIPHAPVGRYRVVYWHEQVGYKDGKAGRLGVPVAIADGGMGVMELPAVSWGFTPR